ncbi:MAG: magnesium-dependent phosphatase-1 [Planctomycetales bacterium]|nr:magnesium-dependent phosphatase-1 [Planctomycetales bacterium]
MNPRLVVFDLDFTLWDCSNRWCDCLTPPFSRRGERVVDAQDREVRLYDDVPNILDECESRATSMGIASRTEQPTWARELLDLLGVSERFAHAEIYPSSKLRHFAALQRATGADYSEMLFFDDELRNIDEVGRLGVVSVHVQQGLTFELFREAIRMFGDCSGTA